MRVVLGVSVGVLVLTGCATSPTPISEAKPVPPERIFVQPTNIAGTPRITVVRDTGYLGAGCDFGFYLDGQLAARLAVGERVSLGVAPGEHILGVASVGRGLCALGENERREIATILNAGDTKVYRVSSRSEGGVAIEPTTMLQSR